MTTTRRRRLEWNGGKTSLDHFSSSFDVFCRFTFTATASIPFLFLCLSFCLPFVSRRSVGRSMLGAKLVFKNFVASSFPPPPSPSAESFTTRTRFHHFSLFCRRLCLCLCRSFVHLKVVKERRSWRRTCCGRNVARKRQRAATGY